MTIWPVFLLLTSWSKCLIVNIKRFSNLTTTTATAAAPGAIKSRLAFQNHIAPSRLTRKHNISGAFTTGNSAHWHTSHIRSRSVVLCGYGTLSTRVSDIIKHHLLPLPLPTLPPPNKNGNTHFKAGGFRLIALVTWRPRDLLSQTMLLNFGVPYLSKGDIFCHFFFLFLLLASHTKCTLSYRRGTTFRPLSKTTK